MHNLISQAKYMKLIDLITARLVIVIVFLCLSPPTISEAQKLKTSINKFESFNDSHRSMFEIVDSATINLNAFQLTPDSAGDVNLQHKSGRILLKRKFKLWDGDNNTINNSTSRRVASFQSSFLINIFPRNGPPGEGLAFLIAPDLNIPSNSSDQYLGLTNSTTNGDPNNHLIAVEFDTVKQDFDPDANHIGLDINSVTSKVNVSLTPLGIELAPELSPPKAKYYNVWVDYDGINKTIEVYIAEQVIDTDPTPPKPNTPVLVSDLDLRGVVNQYSYFGFSASTGNLTQINCVLRWNLTVEYFKDKNLRLTIGLAAGIPSLMVVLLAAVGLGYYIRRKQLALFNPVIIDALRNLPGMPREFRFRDLKKATNNFDEKNKLGQGGYGVVYKGVLPKEDLVVAVKRFSRESIKGKDDFLAELTIINRLRHRHLVRLLGWCHKNGKLLLVYDYMPNGSLDKHLFGEPGSKPLSWELRYKIVSGVASALHYLHDEYDQTVVHRDIKASNIMVDSNFNARLGDFGLARAIDNEKTSYAEVEGVHGTFGYIAPECFHTGKATQQSDTYAFGAVLMEVVCGLKPVANIGKFQVLVDWVWSLYREGHVLDAVDKRLGDEFVGEEAERLLLLGLACSHPIASERPKTQTIVQIISGSMSVPYVPPFKPAFMWPSMPMGDEDITDVTMGDTTSNSSVPLWIGSDSTIPSRESYSLSDNSLV